MSFIYGTPPPTPSTLNIRIRVRIKIQRIRNTIKFSGWNKSGAYGNGKYVFITTQPEIIYSTDGINWSAVDLTNISTQLQGICFANGKFVSVGNGGSGTSLATHNFCILQMELLGKKVLL